MAWWELPALPYGASPTPGAARHEQVTASINAAAVRLSESGVAGVP